MLRRDLLRDLGSLLVTAPRALTNVARMTGARLTTFLPTFAAEDPGSWDRTFDLARAADEACADTAASRTTRRMPILTPQRDRTAGA